MIYKEHFIEMTVNGNHVDIEDQKTLNMRFNNTILDPTKITNTQAEYSFEFSVPATANNNKVFDYANNLSKNSKFRQRYVADVYCDGTVIFSGALTVNSYKEGKYNLNLVSVKVFSYDEIFGDSKMTDIRPFVRSANGIIERDEKNEPLHQKWAIEFNGVSTINERNNMSNTDVTFPLVSYGVFQKKPYNQDEVGNDYTSKFDLDEWNRWYVESFYPSHNMLETLKNCFETKNYVVGGDAFQNQYLKNIYMSVNLADGQDPEYNVGNPRFGKADISLTLSTQQGNAYEQELNFPYFKVYCPSSGTDGLEPSTEYNWEAIDVYNLLGHSGVTVNNTPNYMYQPDEGIIVVPANGWYKVELSANTTITTTGNITAAQYVVNMSTSESSQQNVTMPVGIKEITPVEIQLVRNYDDNIELIKGKNNRCYKNGNPNDTYYTISGSRRYNIEDWLTCFPHEDPYSSDLPTKENELVSKNRKSRRSGRRTSGGGSTSSDNTITSQSGNFSGRRVGTRGGTIDPSGGGRKYSPLDYGYVYNDNEIMCFDQAVSDNFICGLSSLSNGVPAVAKNGYSWSPIVSEKNELFAPVIGYSKVSRQPGSGNIVYEQTDHNYNTYINTPISRCSVSTNSMNGYVSCMIWLNKNDVLSLNAIHRAYTDSVGNKVSYSSTTNARLIVTAFSDRSYDMLLASHDNRYNAPIEFDTKLNLANFFNKEKKISDWVQNIADAFNLDIIQNGNTVTINTRNKVNYGLITAVEVDDRVNSAEAESSKISYPHSMAVKYKIDTDEWGFERSAVESQGGNESILNNDDWMKYGDSGYTIIELNDDTWDTSTSDKNLQFSYTWYDKFNHYQCSSAYTKTSDSPVIISMPVISKFSYMIDGYSYDESMKYDGYGLSQRFWFKPVQNNGTLWTRTYPPESVNIFTPVRYMYSGGKYLYASYKNTEKSFLTEFFNLSSYLASNYVEIEVYLSPDEYMRIKNGAYVNFDSDLYIPVDISGYDPTNNNRTVLKMMKKII